MGNFNCRRKGVTFLGEGVEGSVADDFAALVLVHGGEAAAGGGLGPLESATLEPFGMYPEAGPISMQEFD